MTDWQPLFDLAFAARRNSYCPVSGFAVGSAIRARNGELFSGTNVEDGAHTSTIHAEQGALAQLVTRRGRQKIDAIVCVGAPCSAEDKPFQTMPCGHCRQLLLDFTDEKTRVASFSLTGEKLWEGSFNELVPHAFRLACD